MKVLMRGQLILAPSIPEPQDCQVAAEPINTRCFEKESKFFKDGTRRRGKLLPAEAFLLIAENSLAMAARYQPELTNRETGEKQPNPNYNEERYASLTG